MNQDSFENTEADLLLMTIAYNFTSLFKHFIINEKVRNRLSNLRYKLLAIPAYIDEHSDKVIVKIALQMNRRAWIRKLWENHQTSISLLDESNGKIWVKYIERR